MKKFMYLWCAFALFAFAGCSSDKDEWGNDSQEADSKSEEIFLAQANMSPEFSKGYKNSQKQYSTNKEENGTEVVRDNRGMVMSVGFNDTPIRYRPSTPEEFIATYLGVDLKANFMLYRQEQDEYGYTHERYIQYYKGVEVENRGYVFHYNQDVRITYVNGSYLPVTDLDVMPAFSEKTARKIFAKYLNLPVERIVDNVSLYIVDFPLSAESEQWAPRLVYKLGVEFASDEGLCYIDAKTGRILYVWSNYTT